MLPSQQRRATKYINDYNPDYRTRLISLNLLPISMLLELNDLRFFVKSLKNKSPNNSYNISEYVSFKFSHNHTRSGTFSKLVQPCIKNNREKQFYFNRLPYLFWKSFLKKFNPDVSCSYYYRYLSLPKVFLTAQIMLY